MLFVTYMIVDQYEVITFLLNSHVIKTRKRFLDINLDILETKLNYSI
jgi:hypothetical protein